MHSIPVRNRLCTVSIACEAAHFFLRNSNESRSGCFVVSIACEAAHFFLLHTMMIWLCTNCRVSIACEAAHFFLPVNKNSQVQFKHLQSQSPVKRRTSSYGSWLLKQQPVWELTSVSIACEAAHFFLLAMYESVSNAVVLCLNRL